jgi:hypothetical protein
MGKGRKDKELRIQNDGVGFATNTTRNRATRLRGVASPTPTQALGEIFFNRGTLFADPSDLSDAAIAGVFSDGGLGFTT